MNDEIKEPTTETKPRAKAVAAKPATRGDFESPELPNEHVAIECSLAAKDAKGKAIPATGFIVTRSRGQDGGELGEHEVIRELRARGLVTSPTDGVDDYGSVADVVVRAREVFGKARSLGACGPLSVALIVNPK